MKTTTPATAAASDPKATSEAVDAPKAESKNEVKSEVKDVKEGESAQKPGTTDSLFPGWTKTETGRSMPPPQKGAERERKAKTEPVKAESEPKPPVPEEVIDPENLKGKKIKLTIDGKEEILSVEDAIKGIQLEKNLTSKYQALDQREKLLNEREKLIRLQAEAPKPPPPPQEDPMKDSLFSDDPAFKKMNERLEMIARENEELRKATAKLRFDENLKLLDENIKKTYGLEDFYSTYKDRVHQAFLALPVENRASADSPDWWTNQYLALRNKDLQTELEKAKSAKPAPPPPQRREGGIMTGIGDGRGNPVGSDEAQSWDARYKVAFERARNTGDWSEVFQLKEEAKST